MENKTIKYITIAFITVSIMFAGVALMAPVVQVTSGSTITKIYIFDMINSLEAVLAIGYSSSSQATLSDFLTIGTFFVVPTLFLAKNKTLRISTCALSVMLFAYSISSASTMKPILDSLKNYSSSYKISAAPFTLLILSASSSVILALIELFGGMIAELVANVKQGSTVEEKLIENKSLFEQGLITEEEFNARREKILNA